MIENSKLELMKHNLCKAAKTIQQLKEERDEYKISYELLKEDSVSKKDMIRNSRHLESLREINESLESELNKYRKVILEKDRTILKQEEQIRKLKKDYKKHIKTFKEIEEARKELNYEISTTSFKKESTFQFTQIEELLRTFLLKIKEKPFLYQIFKDQVQCKKRFKLLIENENYSVGFQYLLKFILELISNFEFEEEIGSTKQEESFEQLKKDLEDRRSKVAKLGIELEGTMESASLSRSQNMHRPLVSIDKKPEVSQSLFSPKYSQSISCINTSKADTSRSRTPSKSPKPQHSSKNRFSEYKVPFRKREGSLSVAECMGSKEKRK